STRASLNVCAKAAEVLVITSRLRRRGNTERAIARARSRGAKMTIEGVLTAAAEPWRALTSIGSLDGRGGSRNAWNERARLSQHIARIGIRDQFVGVIEGKPATSGDAFGALRRCRRFCRLHQIEVTDLVNQLAAKAKVPIDRFNEAAHREIREAGFLAHLSQGCAIRLLPLFDVALGKAPVLVAVANEEIQR